MTTISGAVQSVSGSSATVTTDTGTTQVAFGPETTFARTVAASRGAVHVGDCIAVASTGQASPGEPVDARSVTVLGATCPPTPGSGVPTPGPGTAAPDLAGGGQSGSPGVPRPSPLPGPRGTITSIDGRTIDITPPGPLGLALRIRTSAATRFATASPATASDLATGDCVVVFGRLPGTTVDALTVTISAPVEGRCAVVT
jgi:hypothetical protein